MRILHITNYFYPYINGVENICKYIVDHSKEHESSVVCFHEKRKDLAGFFSDFWKLRRAIREFNPEVIQLHETSQFAAALLLTMIPKNVKLIVHWHVDVISQTIWCPLTKPIEKKLLERADLVVVTSPQERDGALSLQPYRDKVRIVPVGIDEHMFAPWRYDEFRISEIQRRYQNKPIVFFIASHIKDEGLSYLIEAEKYVKSDCVFVIAGSGPLTKKLESACHSERVCFVGRLSEYELRWHHYTASVFAFPSITKNEAFSVALAEAMYCYTPAVTFTIPGSGVNGVNLNGETGIEVPNRDCKAFGEAIDRLLSDKKLAEQYAKAAHQRVADNFTIPKMMEKMNEVYGEISSDING